MEAAQAIWILDYFKFPNSNPELESAGMSRLGVEELDPTAQRNPDEGKQAAPIRTIRVYRVPLPRGFN